MRALGTATDPYQTQNEEEHARKKDDGARHEEASSHAFPKDKPALPLTKYERVHFLSTRATELAAGAAPLVQMPGCLDPLEVALEELKQGCLHDRVLVRTLPSGEKECYALKQLLP
jgi:DNA-directed RNA polymerase subunit K/omega